MAAISLLSDSRRKHVEHCGDLGRLHGFVAVPVQPPLPVVVEAIADAAPAGLDLGYLARPVVAPARQQDCTCLGAAERFY